MQTYNYKITPAAGTLLNANTNLPANQLINMFGYSIQAVITGTPTGSFKLQGSSDPLGKGSPSITPPTNWTDIANSSTAVTAAGTLLWNVSDVMYNWVRVVYTDTSSGASTATAQIVFNGKGI